MYIKIHKPKEHSANKSSSSNVIQYLEKENIGLDTMEQEKFFNHDSSNISSLMAERKLDSNHYKLGKNDAKFYMMTINPSQKELNFIDNDSEKLKYYVRNVMDKYADNFNRTYKNGEKLQGKDLVYYAKIEQKRTYAYNEKGLEKELKFNKNIDKDIIVINTKLKNPTLLKKDIKALNLLKEKKESSYIRNKDGGIIKAGYSKDGIQTHIHVVVHRYDKQKKFKLSPLSNARNTKNKEVQVGKDKTKRVKVQAGFHRDKFFGECEKVFDENFKYIRPTKEHYEFRKNIKSINKGIHKVTEFQLAVTNPEVYFKSKIKNELLKMVKNKTLQKQLNIASNPKQIPKKMFDQLEKKAIDVAVKAIINNPVMVDPVSIAIKAVLEVAKKVSKQMTKGMGI